MPTGHRSRTTGKKATGRVCSVMALFSSMSCINPMVHTIVPAHAPDSIGCTLTLGLLINWIPSLGVPPSIGVRTCQLTDLLFFFGGFVLAQLLNRSIYLRSPLRTRRGRFVSHTSSMPCSVRMPLLIVRSGSSTF